MSLMQWILVGVGGVLFLAGAVLELIGFLKKKPLVVWKILPAAAAVVGLVLAITTYVGFIGNEQLTLRENYVASRLIELQSYSQGQLSAETAYSRKPNVQSARLVVLGLALEGKYDQGEQAAARYQQAFADETLADLQTLCQDGADGKNVRSNLLQIHMQLKSQMRLSEYDRDKAESIVNIQMTVSTGEGSLSKDLENLKGETDPLSLKASAQGNMYQGNSAQAYEQLEQAALKDPSFPARAALAQMAAGGYRSTMDDMGNVTDSEQAALQQQVSEKNRQIQELQERIDQQSAANEQERQRLEEQIEALEKDVEKLYREISSVPVRRAVNYILAENPSQEDQLAYYLTLAQLYFRSGDMENARTYLEQVIDASVSGSSGYLSVEFADLMEAYDNSVKGVDEIAAGPDEDEDADGSAIEENNDPSKAALKLLNAMCQYTCEGDVYYTQTTEGIDGEDLVESTTFSEFLLEVLADVRAGIHIGKIDTSNFPEISVSVNISRSKEDKGAYQKEDFSILEQGVEITDFELVDSSQQETESSVCMVFDHSGSMAGNNLYQAKRAVASFIQSAGGRMKTGLVAFDDMAEIVSPVSGSTGMVQRAVDSLTADGGTDISKGLLAGMNALQGSSGNRILILLSDGADNSSSAAVMDSVVNQLVQQGIVVYAVGFDFADSAYLSGICEATGGKFLRSESSEDLGSVYQTIEKYLSQDYVLRFTVTEDAANFEREMRVSLDGGVFDERDYFVGVSPDKIKQEETIPVQSDYFQQTGGSGREEDEQ